MKPQLSIEAFADWCEKQPAEREYDYYNWRECACAQYAATLGISAEAWINHAIDHATSMWGEANCIASEAPFTFGALSLRLRQTSRSGS